MDSASQEAQLQGQLTAVVEGGWRREVVFLIFELGSLTLSELPRSTAPHLRSERARGCVREGLVGEGVGDRGSRAGGFAAAAVAEATRLEEEDEGRRALRRCGRVRWAGGEGVCSGEGDWPPQVLPPRAR